MKFCGGASCTIAELLELAIELPGILEEIALDDVVLDDSELDSGVLDETALDESTDDAGWIEDAGVVGVESPPELPPQAINVDVIAMTKGMRQLSSMEHLRKKTNRN